MSESEWRPVSETPRLDRRRETAITAGAAAIGLLLIGLGGWLFLPIPFAIAVGAWWGR